MPRRVSCTEATLPSARLTTAPFLVVATVWLAAIGRPPGPVADFLPTPAAPPLAEVAPAGPLAPAAAPDLEAAPGVPLPAVPAVAPLPAVVVLAPFPAVLAAGALPAVVGPLLAVVGPFPAPAVVGPCEAVVGPWEAVVGPCDAVLGPFAAPPPPPPPPPAEAPVVSLGQTPDEVVAALGQPVKKAKIGTKEIYFYKDLKVTFVNNKVKDIQ